MAASAGSAGATRPRPVNIPSATRRASPALARLLGLQPPGAPLADGVRVNAASWEGSVLSVEVEGTSLAPQRVFIAPGDGARFYKRTARLGLSYSGREAPPALLRTLDAIAASLEPLDIDDLRRTTE